LGEKGRLRKGIAAEIFRGIKIKRIRKTQKIRRKRKRTKRILWALKGSLIKGAWYEEDERRIGKIKRIRRNWKENSWIRASKS